MVRDEGVGKLSKEGERRGRVERLRESLEKRGGGARKERKRKTRGRKKGEGQGEQGRGQGDRGYQ